MRMQIVNFGNGVIRTVFEPSHDYLSFFTAFNPPAARIEAMRLSRPTWGGGSFATDVGGGGGGGGGGPPAVALSDDDDDDDAAAVALILELLDEVRVLEEVLEVKLRVECFFEGTDEEAEVLLEPGLLEEEEEPVRDLVEAMPPCVVVGAEMDAEVPSDRRMALAEELSNG